MWDRQYKVTMQTPIGERYGHMAVTIEDRQIEGVLTILKQAAPFQGEICEDGTCRIFGKLFTLMHTIAYEATGQIEEKTLHLILKAEKGSFELSGTALDSDLFSGEEAL